MHIIPKNRSLVRVAASLLLTLSVCVGAAGTLAQATAAANTGERLELNDRLLASARRELENYRAGLPDTPPDLAQQKRLEALSLKVRALEEESASLRALRPLEEQAGIFIKDLVNRRLAAEAQRRLDLEQKASALKDAHERALELVSRNRLAEAAQLYEEILLRDPDDDEAYMILGHTSILMGRYERAEQAFANAVHIDPANMSEIVPFYENLILQEPSAENYTHLGYAALIAGDIPSARRSFREALNADPGAEDARAGLSLVAS